MSEQKLFSKPEAPFEISYEEKAYEMWLHEDGDYPPLKTRLLRALNHCIQNDLSEHQREALLLFLEYGTARKVAKIMDVNVSTASRTIRRAMQNVGERIKYVDPILYEHDINIISHLRGWKNK